MRDDFPVMLFAAGFGTRMRPLTDAVPKPMIAVAGRPLIDHALEQVRGYGAGRIVANLHYKPAPLIAHLKDSEVQLSHETPEILDTGGGLRAALPLLESDTVFTMNTDAVWQGPNPLALLAERWTPERMDALLLCIQPENATGHAGPGDFQIGPDGRVERGPGAIYSGLQIIKTGGLHDIPGPVFSLNLLWNRMLAQGRLFAMTYPGRWADVGTPDGVTLAETMLGAGDV